MNRKIAPGTRFKIGTRGSPLAMKQVDEVVGLLRGLFPDIKVDVLRVDTRGDKDRRTPISDIEGTDFFTREIEEKLLDGKIDLAVHSAKDLPDALPDGLSIAAITESIDPYDALVSKSNLKLDELPRRALIGTSSLRRKTQLKAYRSDFKIVDIRGNIEERLRLLDCNDVRCTPFDPSTKAQDRTLSNVEGFDRLRACPERSRGTMYDVQKIDAIVIAACALLRLGLENRITQRIPFEILRPHPWQGALAIETRSDRIDLAKLFAKIDYRRSGGSFPIGSETVSRWDWKASHWKASL